MEVIKIHNLKSAKQLIENQNKIKLDIYESLENTFLKNSKKIFDLLIITYYKSIDFNKRIYRYTILECMFIYKSKHLNFILNQEINVNLNINSNINLFPCYCSYKSFNILINIYIKKNLKFNIDNIFKFLCANKGLKFIKLFISIIKSSINIKDLIFKNLDYIYKLKFNIFKYLIYLIKPDFNPSIDALIKTRNEDILKYLIKNYNFNPNNKYEISTILYSDLNIIKLIFKYNGNIDLESKDIFNKTLIYIEDIKLFKFLVKYINSDNIYFMSSEMFKFIIFKKKFIK